MKLIVKRERGKERRREREREGDEVLGLRADYKWG